METKDIIINLRRNRGMTQDQLAEKLYVTRQAVSRWETGDTTPDIQTLKQLSHLFDVSINTLLGSPRALICQCCGMPMTDEILSREPNGSLNEDYCKWCYTDGNFVYPTVEQLLDYLVEHAAPKGMEKDSIRTIFSQALSQLQHWKK